MIIFPIVLIGGIIIGCYVVAKFFNVISKEDTVVADYYKKMSVNKVNITAQLFNIS